MAVAGGAGYARGSRGDATKRVTTSDAPIDRVVPTSTIRSTVGRTTTTTRPKSVATSSTTARRIRVRPTTPPRLTITRTVDFLNEDSVRFSGPIDGVPASPPAGGDPPE